MQQLSLKMSVDEVQALLEMVENQLFRMKFIDPKIPGHRANPEKIRHSSAAIGTLQEALKRAKGYKVRGV